MPLPKTSLADFEEHLRALGVTEGMNLAIHSNMMSFGRLEGRLDGAYAILRKVIGGAATIVVPTYNLGLGPDQPYDPATTPAQAMGVFTNYMMQREGAVRTLCPMHSHMIEGPLQEALLAADPNQSMGPGSIFQAMMENDFSLLLLGCSFHEGATFVHHVEACTGVGYREWLDLPRKVQHPAGPIEEVTVRYYGRKRDSGLTTALKPLQDAVHASGVCTTVPIHQAASHRMNLADLFGTVQDLLAQDPTIMMAPIED